VTAGGTEPPDLQTAGREPDTARRHEHSGRGEVSMVPPATPSSYYGRPVVKRPVWRPEVAAYLFAGGLAGGSTLLCAAARRQGNHVLARRGLYTALAGLSVSPALLIMDLGVPRRFHHMLRVVKVTSPMNLGTWILTATGTATGIAAGCDLLGVMPRLQRTAETSAALMGPALSTYTAVLLADTAVPVWHEARRELPFVFAASSLASAGAAAAVLTPPTHAAMARTLATGSALGELGLVRVMKWRLGELGQVYREGTPHLAGRTAATLNAAGAAALAVAGRRRPLAMLGGLSILAGAALQRWAVFTAGTASASDPKYTVAPQRTRLRSRQRRQLLGGAGALEP
jgi:hypothetical protein